MIDFAVLEDEFGGDDEFVRELLQTYVTAAPGLVGDIGRCLDAGDAKGAYEALHRLKGALGYLRAEPALRRIRALEIVCHGGDLISARSLWPSARPVLEKVAEVAGEFLGD